MVLGLLKEASSTAEVTWCIQISLLCVQENLPERPNMSHVLAMLNNEAMTLPEPKQPAFLQSYLQLKKKKKNRKKRYALSTMSPSRMQVGGNNIFHISKQCCIFMLSEPEPRMGQGQLNTVPGVVVFLAQCQDCSVEFLPGSTKCVWFTWTAKRNNDREWRFLRKAERCFLGDSSNQWVNWLLPLPYSDYHNAVCLFTLVNPMNESMYPLHRKPSGASWLFISCTTSWFTGVDVYIYIQGCGWMSPSDLPRFHFQVLSSSMGWGSSLSGFPDTCDVWILVLAMLCVCTTMTSRNWFTDYW